MVGLVLLLKPALAVLRKLVSIVFKSNAYKVDKVKKNTLKEKQQVAKNVKKIMKGTGKPGKYYL